MSKVKASFSRKPVVDGLRISGTITRGGTRPFATAEITEGDADALLKAIVDVIDSTQFEVETLDVTLG